MCSGSLYCSNGECSLLRLGCILNFYSVEFEPYHVNTYLRGSNQVRHTPAIQRKILEVADSYMKWTDYVVYVADSKFFSKFFSV